MTKEDKEAIIRRLEAMYGEAEDNETKEALFYAIEALKRQQLILCHNITAKQISDAFQVAIANYWEEKSKYLTPPPSPSSPPSPCCDSKNKMEHGEWIETSNIWETEDLSGWGYWKECSSCHCQEKRRTSFCPNCGAKMEVK